MSERFFPLYSYIFCFVCFDVARGVCQPTGLALSEVVARMPPSPAPNLLPRLVNTSAANVLEGITEQGRRER